MISDLEIAAGKLHVFWQLDCLRANNKLGLLIRALLSNGHPSEALALWSSKQIVKKVSGFY